MQGRERIPLHNRQKNPHGTPVRLAVAFRSTRLRSNHRSSFINAQLALPDHTTALRLLNPQWSHAFWTGRLLKDLD